VESPEAVLAIPVYASPPEQAAGESIARALTKRISLDCRGKRLADFAAEIRTATGANVVLDGGVDGDNVRITAIASNVDVRSVLRHALAEHLLTWEARHEAIVICAALDKTRYGPTVAYLAPKTDINALRAVMQATVNPSEWDGFGESGYALRLSLGKTRFLAISDSEAVHAEIARLLALLDAIERETAAGRPALCYGQDFADGSLRSAVAKTLSRKVSLDIEKQPLQAVLTDLKTRYGLDAAMDEKDGDVLRIAGNALVSVRVEDVSLRTALKQMLRPLGLSWMAGESKVTIARLDFGDEFRTTRFYPVADLVGEKDAAAECRNALDALVETIKVETVGPSVTLKDWEAPDRPSTIVGLALGNAKVLAVNQTDAIHDSVVALLAKLRAARGPRRGVM